MNNLSKWIQWGFDPITKKITMITKSEDGVLIEKAMDEIPLSCNSFSELDEARHRQKRAQDEWVRSFLDYEKGLTTLDNVLNAMNVLNAIEIDIFNEHERIDISDYKGVSPILLENDKRVPVKELLGDDYFRYVNFLRNNKKGKEKCKIV